VRSSASVIAAVVIADVVLDAFTDAVCGVRVCGARVCGARVCGARDALWARIPALGASHVATVAIVRAAVLTCDEFVRCIGAGQSERARVWCPRVRRERLRKVALDRHRFN